MKKPILSVAQQRMLEEVLEHDEFNPGCQVEFDRNGNDLRTAQSLVRRGLVTIGLVERFDLSFEVQLTTKGRALFLRDGKAIESHIRQLAAEGTSVDAGLVVQLLDSQRECS